MYTFQKHFSALLSFWKQGVYFSLNLDGNAFPQQQQK